MNKKTAAAVCILTVVMLSLYAGGSHEDEVLDVQNETTTVTGHIVIYGSVPHTFPGIQCDDGRQYSITGRKEITDELEKSQGYHIEVTGIVTENRKKVPFFTTLKDGSIEVLSWKAVQ